MRFLAFDEQVALGLTSKDSESTLYVSSSSSVIKNSITNNQNVGAGRKSDSNGNAKQNSESKSSATYAAKTRKDSGNTAQIKNNELEKKTAVAFNSKSSQKQQNVSEPLEALVNRGERLEGLDKQGAKLTGLSGVFRGNAGALLEKKEQENRNWNWLWPFR